MKKNSRKDEYPFINEVIKQKSPDKKRIAKWMAMAMLFVIVAAAVAAIVFVKVVSVAGGYLDTEAESKVAIPEDQAPVETEDTADGEATETTDETQQDEESETASDDKENLQGITGDEYEELCRQMADIVEAHRNSMVRIICVDSEVGYFNENYEDTQEASGIIIADNSLEIFILADANALTSTDNIQVLLENGTYVEATLVKSDKETGLVVLEVAKKKIPASIREDIVPMDLGNSYKLQVGQPVIAVGELSGYKESVSFGNITSLNNIYPYYDVQYSLFSTDVAMSGGSGFLMNLQGELIGVITEKTIPSGSSVYTGIGISEVKSLIERLSNKEKEPYLGIKIEEITEEVARKTNLPEGLLVTATQNDASAMLAGILPMDIITEIDGTALSSYAAYRNWLKTATPGETVEVKALRSGKEGYEETSFEVTIGER